MAPAWRAATARATAIMVLPTPGGPTRGSGRVRRPRHIHPRRWPRRDPLGSAGTAHEQEDVPGGQVYCDDDRGDDDEEVGAGGALLGVRPCRHCPLPVRRGCGALGAASPAPRGVRAVPPSYGTRAVDVNSVAGTEQGPTWLACSHLTRNSPSMGWQVGRAWRSHRERSGRTHIPSPPPRRRSVARGARLAVNC